MQLWVQSDMNSAMAKLGQTMPGQKEVFTKPMVEQSVAAILEQPTLTALASNACAATVLLRAVQKLNTATCMPHSKKSWLVRLRDMMPALVVEVVAKYMNNNGLRNINDNQRRRVAASVLHAVHGAKKEASTQMPKFVGLSDDVEESCAHALVDTNIENSSNGSCFPQSKYPIAALMSPALIIVACSMLGVPTQILSNFKAQNVITALYVDDYQKALTSLEGTTAECDEQSLVVQPIDECQINVNPQGNFQKVARAQLECALARLEVFHLTTRASVPRSIESVVAISILGKDFTLMQMAPLPLM
jgi:hypothetical protein